MHGVQLEVKPSVLHIHSVHFPHSRNLFFSPQPVKYFYLITTLPVIFASQTWLLFCKRVMAKIIITEMVFVHFEKRKKKEKENPSSPKQFAAE